MEGENLGVTDELFQFYLEQISKGHYETALVALKRSIEEGNNDALCEMGLHYKLGTLTLIKDEDEAKQLFLKAANRGCARAMLNYGRFLQNAGNDECHQWFEKAFQTNPPDPFVQGWCVMLIEMGSLLCLKEDVIMKV